MNSLIRLFPIACIAGAVSLTGNTALASYIEITYENLSEEGGLWNTPLFLGFHDGSYDLFDLNDPLSPTSAGLEALAENGDTSGLLSDIAGIDGAKSSVLAGPGGLFNPGSENSLTIKLDAVDNRYLTFASMLLPSNDAFIGNHNPTAYALFNGAGVFNDGFVINIFGSSVWDSGTEVNDTFGAPFSMIGGMSTDIPGGYSVNHPGLDNFIGTGLGNGSTLERAFDSDTAIGRITARRVPDSTAGTGLISISLLLILQHFARRHKKANA